MRGHREKMAIY